MTITVYGSSDDLIEIEGDIREEFYAIDIGQSDEGGLLAFSDGTVLRIAYTDDGVWRITPVHTGLCTFNIVQAVSADDDNYSDRATLSGETISWVVLGSKIASIAT